MQKEEPELPAFPGRVDTVPQRVWILMGGDSSQRQASLASGLNAFMALRHQAEITVSICIPLTRAQDKTVCSTGMMVSWKHVSANPLVFLLTLRYAGAAQRKQQRTLLRPRADLL